MMKILANEKFPMAAVGALRDAGHDVLWARTEMGGEGDEAILARAQREGRLVVTFDKDFGDLAFHWGLSAACGVALFRLRTQSPDYVRDRVLEAFSTFGQWRGHFSVVEHHRIRVRPLPRRGE